MSMETFLFSTLSILSHFWHNWKFLVSCHFIFLFHITFSLFSFIFRKFYVLIIFFILCIIWCFDNLRPCSSRIVCPFQGWLIPKDNKWFLCECACHEPINTNPMSQPLPVSGPYRALKLKADIRFPDFPKTSHQTTYHKDNPFPFYKGLLICSSNHVSMTSKLLLKLSLLLQLVSSICMHLHSWHFQMCISILDFLPELTD